MGQNEIFSLNRTGARLWELLSEGRTRSAAVEQLTTEFDVCAETVEEEATNLIALLERHGLVELNQSD
jgi:hypothetical protein